MAAQLRFLVADSPVDDLYEWLADRERREIAEARGIPEAKPPCDAPKPRLCRYCLSPLTSGSAFCDETCEDLAGICARRWTGRSARRPSHFVGAEKLPLPRPQETTFAMAPVATNTPPTVATQVSGKPIPKAVNARLATFDPRIREAFQAHGLLLPEQRIQLLQSYADGNAWIAREYLGRPDGALFLEPWPRPEDAWTSYPGLGADKAAELAFYVYQALQREAGESGSRHGKGESLRRAMKQSWKRNLEGKALLSRLRPRSKRKPEVAHSPSALKELSWAGQRAPPV